MINQLRPGERGVGWGAEGGCCGERVQPASAKHLPGVGAGARGGVGGGTPRGCGRGSWRHPGVGRRSLPEAIKLNFQATALYTLSWGAPFPRNSPQVAQRESSSVKITWTFKSPFVEEALSFLPETWG